MKKIFITFGDSRLRRSTLRLQKQAVAIDYFDSIKRLDESSLSHKFKEDFSHVLILGSRGFGYWCWKPAIIAHELSLMSTGDALLYMDAGSHLVPTGKKRLHEYFEIAKQHVSGILAFDSSYPLESVMGFYTDRQQWDAHFHPCYKHIKADALQYFSKLNDQEFLSSPMVEAGHLIIVKNKNSVALVKEWQKISQDAFHLFDDSESQMPNLPGFVEHRHDQAIFTILARKYKIETLSNAETYYPSEHDNKIPDWEKIKEFPIHGRRDKDFGFLRSLNKMFFKNMILRLLHNALRAARLEV